MKLSFKSLFFVLSLLMLSFVNPVFAGDLRDVNTATASQLTEVKGIGEKTAAAIVTYREAHHGIKDMKELLAVKGIGEKTLEKIKAVFTVKTAAKSAPKKPAAPAK